MSTPTKTYDVFLSYSVTEAATAKLVERALAEAGLDVFVPSKAETGERVQDALWRALAESAAVVVILSPDRAPASSTAVELGGAIAWRKAIHLVQPESARAHLPAYLSEYPVYPVSRIDDLVRSVMRALEPLSQEDRDGLCEIYEELGIPADRLLKEPSAVDRLARAFRSRRHKQMPGERLVRELIRLRKAGNLPRLVRA